MFSNAAVPRRIDRQACRACRKVKTRCLHDHDLTRPCLRCKRIALPCDYSRDRRGRKTNAERAATGYLPEASSTCPRGEEKSENKSHGAIMDGLSHETSFDSLQLSHGMLSLPVSEESQSYTLDAQLLPKATQDNTPHHSVSSVGEVSHPPNPASTMDVSRILDPDQVQDDPPDEVNGNEHHPGTTGRQTFLSRDPASLLRMRFEDPVELDYLTIPEAKLLVAFFHQHLNPLIALLDSHLHTLEYLRSTSSVLFTAVLASAARFLRHEFHKPLHDHAHNLLNRATNIGATSLGLVQALMILTYWKMPTDRSGWLKIGMASRMAYQMGYHLQTPRVLPENDMEARKLLDAERTWYCLACFDRTYCSIFGLPAMIAPSEIGDCESWAIEHLYLDIPSDMHLAASVQMPDGHESFRMLQREHNSLSRDITAQLCHFLMAQFRGHLRKWFDQPYDPRLTMPPGEVALLKWWDLSAMLDLQNKLVEIYSPGEAASATIECLEIAARCVEQVEQLAERGHLLYLQDAGSVSLSSFGRLIGKIYWRLTSQQKSYSIQLLRRVNQSCENVAMGDTNAATAFASRFLQRLLQKIEDQSRVASRQMSPDVFNFSANGAHPVSDLDMAAVLELDDFLRISAPAPNGFSDDHLYWSALIQQ